jgi:hypothetical protein
MDRADTFPTSSRQNSGASSTEEILHRFGILIEAKRTDQTIELLGQRGDSSFAPLQPGLTRPGIDTRNQPLIRATNDLQRLSEIMPCNAEKRRLEIAGALQLQYPGVDFRCLGIRKADQLDAPVLSCPAM